MKVLREYEVTVEGEDEVRKDLEKLEKVTGQDSLFLQLVDVATRYYDGGDTSTEALVLFSENREGRAIDYLWLESGDVYGNSDFTHVYGPVNVAAVETGIEFRE